MRADSDQSTLRSCLPRFVNVINDEIRQAQGNEEYYFGNPINAYLFIKHLTAEWYGIEELLPSGRTPCQLSLLELIFTLDFSKGMDDLWIFPSFEDYRGTHLYVPPSSSHAYI